MSELVAARRAMCACCLRPQSACICRWVVPLAAEVEVLILQHPLESGNAKGSARLLHLSLPNSRLAVGEVFAGDDLLALLHAPWAAASIDGGPVGAQRHAVLLYPDMPGCPGNVNGSGAEHDAGAMPQGDRPRAPACLRLVVLDATWRKSRKMLYLNPALQALPRLALADVPSSRYLIRKAHLPHQLSTLEATCLALMRLEGDARKFAPLLDAFDGFIGQQRSYFPR